MPSLISTVRQYAAGSLKAAAALVGVKARSDVPKTGKYDANVRRPGWMGSAWQKRPPFTLAWADLMRVDHQVKFGLCIRNGPAYGLQVEVESPRPEVAEFARKQWERIWTQEAEKLLRDQHYGFLGFETMYRYADGQYQFDRYIDRHPGDTRPLSLGSKLVGVSFSGLRDSKVGLRRLWGPQCLWLTYDAECGSLFGTAILESAFAPWYEKTMENGAVRMRQLRMIKDAWIGDVMYYDENYTIQTLAGQTLTGQQIAAELVENRASGGVMALPMRITGNGTPEKILEYEGPTPVNGATQIMEWVHDLDWDILDGLEIPREVVEASETGSGYSGRAVPNAKFLAGLNPKLGNRVRQVKEQTLVPLVAANFGSDAADEFDVKLIPLEKTMQENQPEEPPAAPARPMPPGQQGQQQNGQQQRGPTQNQFGGQQQRKEQPQQFAAWDESEHPRDDGGRFTFDRGPALHKKVADAVESGIKALQARGIRMPDKIQIAKLNSNSIAWFDSNDHDIGHRITVDPRRWPSPELVAKAKAAGARSTDNPLHSLHHEMGHFLHKLNGADFDRLRNHRFEGDIKAAIEKEVSTYATTNGGEFVAEVVAGLLHGEKYSETIMRQFKFLGGPDIPPAADDDFTLARESTKGKPKPAKFDSNDRTKQRKLLDGMDSLPGQMDLFSISDDGQAIQFRADPDGSRWITIGGRASGDEKHKGGFPVLISSDGKILRSGGLQSIVGKKISGLKRHFSALKKKREKEASGFDPSEFDPSMRKVDRKSRVGSAIAEAAEKHGVGEGDLAEAVDVVWKEKRDAINEREAAKKGAREKTGLTAGLINKWEDANKDYSTYPGLDDLARQVAGEFPELGIGRGYEDEGAHGHDDYAGALWEILKEGRKQPPAKHDEDLIDEAAGLVLSGRMSDEDIDRLERMRAVAFAVDDPDGSRAGLRNRVRSRLSRLLDRSARE